MLAACQVLTMLTGGIDLSWGIVATCAAFVAATLTPLIGAAPAMLVAMAVGAIVGSSTASAPPSRGCIR
jgi:ribose transport system permease protein